MWRTTTNNNCRVLLVVNERLARRQWMTLLLMMTLIIGTRNYYVGSGTPVGNYAISYKATAVQHTMIINGRGQSFCFKVWWSAGDKMLWLRLRVTSFVITRSRTWPGSQSDTPGTKIVQSFHAKERKKQVEIRVRSNRSSSLPPTGFTKSCLVELLENLCPVSAENALLLLSLPTRLSISIPVFWRPETMSNVRWVLNPVNIMSSRWAVTRVKYLDIGVFINGQNQTKHSPA